MGDEGLLWSERHGLEEKGTMACDEMTPIARDAFDAGEGMEWKEREYLKENL